MSYKHLAALRPGKTQLRFQQLTIPSPRDGSKPAFPARLQVNLGLVMTEEYF